MLNRFATFIQALNYPTSCSCQYCSVFGVNAVGLVSCKERAAKLNDCFAEQGCFATVR